MRTGVASVKIDRCSNIDGVLAEDVERSRGGDPDSAPRDRFRLTIAVLMLDIETEWTLNALLTTSSSYRKCSKRRTLDHSAQATSLMQIEGMTKCSLTARGFGCGSGMVSVAEPSLRYSDCPKSRPRLPQEFRTRIGETASRIELECFPRRSKWTAQFRPKT